MANHKDVSRIRAPIGSVLAEPFAHLCTALIFCVFFRGGGRVGNGNVNAVQRLAKSDGFKSDIQSRTTRRPTLAASS